MEQLLWRFEDETINFSQYDYIAPYKSVDNSVEEALIKGLSETNAFRRLSDIRFLGALDYRMVSHPNGSPANARFTRAQHSLGVAKLARTYLSYRKHAQRDRLACVAAAMLHDIGHAPFSHTLEPLLKRTFKLDHHEASENIILGTSILGTSIPDALNKFGIDPDHIIDILRGNDAEFDNFFSGPINFDTIEGILRSRSYLKMPDLMLGPQTVVEAASNRVSTKSRDLVDAFWNAKDEIYALVIRSRSGVLFDTLFQEVARQSIDDLSSDVFYMTETQVFRKIPRLRDAAKKDSWQALALSLLPDEIPYFVRRFYVDSSADFFSREDHIRYRQEKHLGSLTLSSVVPA